jgi:hypothetical protein
VGSTTCEPAWEITRPNTACTTTRQPGSSRRDVADPVSRGAPTTAAGRALRTSDTAARY